MTWSNTLYLEEASHKYRLNLILFSLYIWLMRLFDYSKPYKYESILIQLFPGYGVVMSLVWNSSLNDKMEKFQHF